MHDRSLPVRRVIQLLSLVAILMFFFPVISIQVPTVGSRAWSGYDIFPAVKDLSGELRSIHGLGDFGASVLPGLSAATRNRGHDFSDLPFSVKALSFIPVEILLSLLAALATGIFASFRRTTKAAGLLALIGCVLAVLAMVHLASINSGIHAWMRMRVGSASQSHSFFHRLAGAMIADAMRSFQVRAGVGLYVLAAALAGAAVLSSFASLMNSRSVEVSGPPREISQPPERG